MIVEPFVEQSQPFEQLSPNFVSREWMDTFHVEYFPDDAQSSSTTILDCPIRGSKCSTLTKCELVGGETTNSAADNYLISIQALESPMQALTQKETTTSMRKFVQSISNSYSERYYEEKSGAVVVWAMLRTSYTPPNENNCGFEKPKLKISNFLRRQLRLFEVNPKVLVRFRLVTNELEQSVLATRSSKNVTLKTNYTKNVGFFSKFISK